MTIRNLDPILAPQSIALIGASPKPGSVGQIVLRNVASNGFKGKVYPVNPKHDAINGLTCYRKIADLPEAPDIAVIMTPPKSVPRAISQLAKRGTRTAVVLTAGINDGNGLRQKMLDAAKPHLFRVIGPNTVGMMAPHVGLNASFTHMAPMPGKLALLSQSGAIVTALIDWAADRDVGFSHIVSLGDMADVDMADCIDLLAMDRHTKAILLYLESIPNPRKFISAARAASRLKPVLAVKSGRHDAAAKAAATHTGALAGSDTVVDAILRRAGVVRVKDLDDLFLAAETIEHFSSIPDMRVGIVTNGGGAGVLAVDQMMDYGSDLAELSPETIEALNAVLPPTWSKSNPVDIIGDAPPKRYRDAVSIVARDPGVDAILVMCCPTALASPIAAAQEISAMVENGRINRKPVFGCWLGEHSAKGARHVLRKSGVASFDTPAQAAEAMSLLESWTQSQRLLTRVPAFGGDEPTGDTAVAAEIFRAVADEGRTILTEPEAKRVFSAYGIPTPPSLVARDAAEARKVAEELLPGHGRLVVKLLSRDITHKTDVGGVALGLESAEAVSQAVLGMTAKIGNTRPDARIDGFMIQPMVSLPDSNELIIGMKHDPTFGPVILFGAGGTAVEVLKDTAIALPPIDDVLAGDLIDQTRIGRLLAGYRGHRPADRAMIIKMIRAVSNLVVDFPCVSGIDINPLLVSENHALALDARIVIDPERVGEPGPNPDLAMRPYPNAWTKKITVENGTEVVLRAIRPEDAALYPTFLDKTSADDIRMRLLTSISRFTDAELVRLTQLDYSRSMAFVAIIGASAESQGELAGVSRLMADANHERAEFGLIVRGDLQGLGLGWSLMQHLLDYAKADGLSVVDGVTFKENKRMRQMCEELGFTQKMSRESPELVELELKL